MSKGVDERDVGGCEVLAGVKCWEGCWRVLKGGAKAVSTEAVSTKLRSTVLHGGHGCMFGCMFGSAGWWT